MTDALPEPELTFPEREWKAVSEAYERARVILEYGSGGSTLYAARMTGKLVMSVESDRAWAMRLQRTIDTAKTASSAFVYPVDIGPTGTWGRPMDDSNWRKFSHYPTRIWAEPFFRQPDVVLIDGRMRAACFVATFLRIVKPTHVLFDDYANRLAYHVVEKLAVPFRTSGRLAEFRIDPGDRPIWVHDLYTELIGDCTLDTQHDFTYPAHAETSYPFNKSISRT